MIGKRGRKNSQQEPLLKWDNSLPSSSPPPDVALSLPNPFPTGHKAIEVEPLYSKERHQERKDIQKTRVRSISFFLFNNRCIIIERFIIVKTE